MKSRLDMAFLMDTTEILRAIAHPIRIAIVDLLHKNEKLTVSEIHQTLDIEQAVTSHHLRILKDRGVLNSYRKGKNTYYVLKDLEFGRVVHIIEKLKAATPKRHAA